MHSYRAWPEPQGLWFAGDEQEFSAFLCGLSPNFVPGVASGIAPCNAAAYVACRASHRTWRWEPQLSNERQHVQSRRFRCMDFPWFVTYSEGTFACSAYDFPYSTVSELGARELGTPARAKHSNHQHDKHHTDA